MLYPQLDPVQKGTGCQTAQPMLWETQHKRVGDEPPLFAALRTKRFAMPTLSWVQHSWCQGQQLTGAEPAGSGVILRSCLYSLHYMLELGCHICSATRNHSQHVSLKYPPPGAGTRGLLVYCNYNTSRCASLLAEALAPGSSGSHCQGLLQPY